MDKKIFGFFLLFSLVLFLGCIGGGEKPSSEEQVGIVNKGTLNATILINGKPGDSITLLSSQSAQIGLTLKNSGLRTLGNVTGMLLGCLESDLDNPGDIEPKSAQYLSWTVTAPLLGTSEIIKCPTSIRICFDYDSSSYTELVFIPEDYREAPPAPNAATASDFFAFSYNFGVIRVLKSGLNEIVGQISIKNVGPGWVDYIRYQGTNLQIYTVKKLTIDISDIDGVEIVRYGELSQDKLIENGWLDDNKKVLTITEENAGNYLYFLKMIQGKELVPRIVLNITNPELFQDSVNVYTMDVDVEHGYCIDMATINTEMRGR